MVRRTLFAAIPALFFVSCGDLAEEALEDGPDPTGTWKSACAGEKEEGKTEYQIESVAFSRRR